MTPIGSYLFDLPREMEPAIEAIATATGRPMEEIVRVLLNHAVASNPLCRALTAPRMPDLHLSRYTVDIELKRSAVGGVCRRCLGETGGLRDRGGATGQRGRDRQRGLKNAAAVGRRAGDCDGPRRSAASVTQHA